ncbi:MCE family protein [Aeromicrobium sp. CF3.5]|uniref:MCE family protein n=1 Tax=Aeromicrobium sp. CF3.5 TaxID=3373078 RepID=UPI003EE4D8B3
MTIKRRLQISAGAVAVAVGLSGCGFTPYDLPLPGGADLGDDPYVVTAEFRDVLDLVPQSGVQVNDIAVGKVTDIRLNGWNAMVTLEINDDAKLPDNAVASIRQTNLLGEKFVSLEAPESGATGELSDGDAIPLARTGRNPEIEEVLSAASLLFNGGGLERTNTIVKELSQTFDGNEAEIRELLETSNTFLGQIDDNKEAILTSLEKVNRLAITTNNQRDAITGALDDLPEALRVVNDQRDDLVGLLEALNRLGDVATGVIRESKDDVVADLKLLVPTLTNLTKSADDLAFDFQALLTYPFTDGTIGSGADLDGTRNNPIPALGECNAPAGSGDNTGFCVGDFANLDVSLDLSTDVLQSLLESLDLEGLTNLLEALGLGALIPEGGATDGAESEAAPDDEAQGQAESDPNMAELQRTLEGLRLPGADGSSGAPSPGANTSPDGGSPSPDNSSDSDSGSGGGPVCGLLGMCRPAPTSGDGSPDLALLLLQPAVTP